LARWTLKNALMLRTLASAVKSRCTSAWYAAMSASWIVRTKSGPGETRWHWRTASSATARASNAANASADCRSSVTSTIAVSP
jgi:hypothetical protein